MLQQKSSIAAPDTVAAEMTDEGAKSSVSAPDTVAAEMTDEGAKSSVSAPDTVAAEMMDEGAKSKAAKYDKWWLKLVNKNLPPVNPLPEVCTDIFWMNTKVPTIERLWCSDFMENIISTNYMIEIEIERPYYTTHEDCEHFENYGKPKEPVPECFITERGLVGFTAEEGIATEDEKEYAKCLSPWSQPLPKLIKMHNKNAI